MLLASVLGAVLAASWVTPAGAATVPPLRSVGGGDCPTVVAAGADATVIAAECGRDVEVLAERTEWNTVYAQPDGSMRLEASIAAVRSQVTGEWTEIDTSLVATGEGIAVVAPAVEMVFSDGAPGQPLAWMRRDGHELTFDVPFDLGAPVVHGSMLEYRDVLDGVDLIVTVNADGTGFTEVLRVESPQAAADPRIAELVFPVQVSDGLVLAESEGGFAATDAAGERVFGAPPPAMWDSSADLAAPMLTPGVGGLAPMASDGAVPSEGIVANRVARTEAPLEGDRTAVMDLGVDDDAVVVTPDRDILSDPGTVWPVYIDPSVKAGARSEWVSIRDDGWTDYNYTGDQGVGRCGTTGSPMYCSSVFTRRALWEFGDLGVIGNVAADDIVSATFRVYGTHSYSCTPAWVQAWQVGDVSSATRWPGSFNTILEAINVAHKPSCGNDRWIEFNVGAAARNLASAGGSTLGIGLKAGDEATSAGWKRYRYDAALSVTYNLPPNAPSGVKFTNPATPCASGTGRPYVRTTSPTISGVFTDPAGQSVQANVAVYGLPAGIGRSRLNAGEQLAVGERLTSPDGRTYLVMQGDGNLVMYGPGGVNWHTATNGKGGVRLVMQGDGNLVMYTASNVPVWHIGANGLGGKRLDLQDDGNLVVYTATGGVVWQSGTPNVSRIVWTGRSTLQASGAQHSVVVGGLLNGRPYRVQVSAIDADGRAGPSVSCELHIDTQPPVTPTVESLTGGGLAAYPENVTGGGVNQAGAFRFGPGSSTDVVAYMYGIDTAQAGIRLEGSSPTLGYTPSSPGRHYLTVKSVDRAGNVSPTARTYVFWVQNVAITGRWTLDDGAGLTAVDVRSGSQALSLSSSTTWGAGTRAEIWLDDQSDRAIVFDAAGDVASSEQPVVATNRSYSVMAFVRLDDVSAPRTAVSQDGLTASGFELGYRTSGCPSGMAGCWAFAVNTVDGAAPGPVVLASTEPVVAGRWVQLTAVRDTAASQTRLYVCDVGIGEDVSEGIPARVSAEAPALSWNAVGSLRLGQGHAGAVAANPWRGAISAVQVWDGPIDGNEFLRIQDSCRQAVIPELLPQQ